ncbi:GntR family transcriptional regulator [Bradyrhizobium sp. BR13661]|uniref:GntR family transcriptional regulator n=1 Tax=Bradyrhizobium sp. BR13661 TaxID=2940622 RepID=UPI0024770C95|nr:GntR family transcriptional regulator [Bradyrhizobium sp. BR13661]MDH6261787.1 DNA-binding GntR family transcriptional regulator [Bradyrhizobium sp. BR13661]
MPLTLWTGTAIDYALQARQEVGRLKRKKDNAKPPRGHPQEQMRRHFLQAVFEQRVPPGARLTEEALAETFGVSRTVIRQVIARLVQDGILIKQATGATNVAAPTRSETKKMLTVRHMIEPEIVRSLATRSGSLSFDALKSHLDKEDQARAARDRATLVRLVGEFHLMLAQMTDNPILIRLLTKLQALVCLAILLYATEEDACPKGEHRGIVEAMIAGEGERAAEIMRHHLHHIEEDLQLDEIPKVDPHLSGALRWLRDRSVG